MHLSVILTNCIFCKKGIIRLITFSKYNQGVHVPSHFIFRELQVLPLYNLIHNRIGFMMYKSLNGLLPDIMSELCMVNNEVHDHFRRQSIFFCILERETIMLIYKAPITLVRKFVIAYKRRLPFLFQ